jgi:hypothetical protein
MKKMPKQFLPIVKHKDVMSAVFLVFWLNVFLFIVLKNLFNIFYYTFRLSVLMARLVSYALLNVSELPMVD